MSRGWFIEIASQIAWENYWYFSCLFIMIRVIDPLLITRNPAMAWCLLVLRSKPDPSNFLAGHNSVESYGAHFCWR